VRSRSTTAGAADAFLFGSELKALRAFPGFEGRIDRGSLTLFLQLGVVPAPHTIYEGVFKLDAATILTLDAADLADRTLRTTTYWSVADVARRGLAYPFQDEAEAIDAVEAALREAVALQMVADVPVGAFLSGGIDSSTVVALMQAQSARPIRTFTIGFAETGFDEAPHAAAVARHLGTEHHEIYVRPEDARAIIPKLPMIYDEPFADSSQIPTCLVAAAAREQVTVALTGDGGDELFGGYNRYFWPRGIWSRVAWLPPAVRWMLGKSIACLPPDALNALTASHSLGDKAQRLAHRLRSVGTVDDLYRSLVCEWHAAEPPVRGGDVLPLRIDEAALVTGVEPIEQRMMLWDAVSYLPDDILTKVDRASMAVSLETRLPMLDHRVAEVAWRLPLAMKIRNGHGKWALRAVLDRHVPRALFERPKAGFGIPVGAWIRGPLRDWAEDLLDEGRLQEEGYLDAPAIRRLWAEHCSGRRDWTVRLWSVLMFQAWLAEATGARVPGAAVPPRVAE
jgi:asparagine synthase (glutamine-hydrolysing)